jgi:RNA polymerase sigma-54 factor
MHLNLGQFQRQSLQQVLAPRMIQSMEILQMPLMELEERIDQEMAENPFLQRLENKTDTVNDTTERSPDFISEPTKDVERRELVAGKEDNNASDFERLVEFAENVGDDYYSSAAMPSGNRIDEDGDRAHDVMANAEERPQTLHDYLVEQFHYFKSSPEIRAFGEYLIQNLDSNGRLQSSLPEMVQVFGQSIDLTKAEEALRLVQKLDPPGVGARDLKECLLLQIKPETPLREMLVTLISGHLEDIMQNRLPLIQRKTGYSLDDIKATIEQMRTLNPYPGRGYESLPVQSVTADIRVHKDDAGKWQVELIDEYIPQLRINKRYLKLLEGNPDPQTKEFVKKKIESAKWIIDAIEQRYQTLRKVAQAIVDRQADFLEEGPDHIKPLKMQDIADVVGVHVTTISRAVGDKHIETPRGIFPLKRFFGGGTTTSEGEEVAWDIIRIKLKEVVDHEDKRNPLSDDEIVEALATHGFQLARRTVTKYRKALNIPSSRQRREF